MPLGNVGAVFLFEWRRALSPVRVAWWTLLVLFPPGIIALVQLTLRTNRVPPPPSNVWPMMLFALVPMLISMLGTFLWTTSVVSSELERRSWVYLATRPRATTALLLGKYLAAVSWILPAALLGLSIAVVLTGSEASAPLWFTITRLTCLSCPAYAALYMVLGTLFPRRSMVLAVAYTLIFELLISFVPAVINKLTVQFRLRSLLMNWADLAVEDDPDFALLRESLTGDAPAGFHVLVLIAYTLALLVLALVLIRTREFSTSEEVDG